MVTQRQPYDSEQGGRLLYKYRKTRYASNAVHSSLSGNEVGALILSTIQNPPLLALVALFFVTGISIMGWLYREFQANYIWLINHIFMPTLLNALAGLVTTLVSLYTGHHRDWSIMALLTVIVSGLSIASSLGLFIVYKFRKLELLKQEHNHLIYYYSRATHT
ncbi:hypothetical protein N7486_004730 [Penicillium sp. IBT 16267x]|nr:hypothetical protein N7486_004730 [Penicillium sp. IBT 16267x]